MIFMDLWNVKYRLIRFYARIFDWFLFSEHSPADDFSHAQRRRLCYENNQNI